MDIQQNRSLQPFHTFGMDVKARYFASFQSVEMLLELLKTNEAQQHALKILGGGSNILCTKDVDAFVLKNEMEGIFDTEDCGDHFLVKVGAGMNWHQFVMYAIHQDMAGIENLALIPGCVGASPIQNIGAYGVELKDVFYGLEAIHLKEGTFMQLNKEECKFGYRESVFKNVYKDTFAITTVTFRLWKKATLNTSYGAITQELETLGVTNPGIKEVAQAVMNIRNRKLPNPAVLGNAGSFFKNPEIENSLFEKIKIQNPEVPSFSAKPGYTKIPAGWLIEQCGWKGYRKGDAGCYDKQALVLVNYGHATGAEIFELSESIMRSVLEKFGIPLEREVNIWE